MHLIGIDAKRLGVLKAFTSASFLDPATSTSPIAKVPNEDELYAAMSMRT
jgi:hypothetical protein